VLLHHCVLLPVGYLRGEIAIVCGKHPAPPPRQPSGDRSEDRETSEKPGHEIRLEGRRGCRGPPEKIRPRARTYIRFYARVSRGISEIVPEAGFEPACPFGQCVLSASRQPLRHSGGEFGNYSDFIEPNGLWHEGSPFAGTHFEGCLTQCQCQ
jgi:hypothetical protein